MHTHIHVGKEGLTIFQNEGKLKKGGLFKKGGDKYLLPAMSNP